MEAVWRLWTRFGLAYCSVALKNIISLSAPRVVSRPQLIDQVIGSVHVALQPLDRRLTVSITMTFAALFTATEYAKSVGLELIRDL